MPPSFTPAAVAAVTAAPPSPPTHPPPTAEHGGGAGLWLLLLLVALVWAIAHTISVRLHPLRTCRTCRGTGLHHGHLFTHATRLCRRCGGTRREPRPGARITNRRHH